MKAIRSELRQKLEAIGLTSHLVFPSSRDYVEEWDELKPEGFSQEEIVEIMDALLPGKIPLVYARYATCSAVNFINLLLPQFARSLCCHGT
jgi:hypothetical protein